MLKKRRIEQLLSWMEQHLSYQAEFDVSDIEEFFADHFVILTNGRKIDATPNSYRIYLYELKSRLVGVRYTIEEMIEAPTALIAPFIITMNFKDQPARQLRAISIFKFNNEERIIEWKEVFADAHEKQFAYDK